MSDPNEEIGKKYKIGHFHGHIRRPECPSRPPGPAKITGKAIDRCRHLCPGFSGLQTKITLTNTFDNKKIRYTDITAHKMVGF